MEICDRADLMPNSATMSDNPNKTGQDRRTVSDQEHELQYFYGVIEKEFPGTDREQIAAIVQQAKADIAPSTDREELTEAVRKILND